MSRPQRMVIITIDEAHSGMWRTNERRPRRHFSLAQLTRIMAGVVRSQSRRTLQHTGDPAKDARLRRSRIAYDSRRRARRRRK